MKEATRDRLVRSVRAVTGGVGLLCLTSAVVRPHLATNVVLLPKDQFLLGIFGSVLVAAGILGRTFGGAYKATAVVLLNTLLLIAAVELGTSAIDTLGETDAAAPVKHNTVLGAREFQQQHSLEFVASDVKQFEPYVLWRLAPYSGKTITVGRAGLRNTPGSRCNERVYKVFVFGASAIWGAGASDSETIPVFLLRMLEAEGRPVCVVNYAQNGYVLGQNVALLVNLLLQGERPDLVLSYDGFNDAYVAFEQGLAHRQFYYRDLSRIFIQPAAPPWYQSLSIYRRLRPSPSETSQWQDYTNLGKDADRLAADVANHYFSSYSVIEALAAKWKFDFALFVQPTISMSKKPLTPAEQSVRANVSEPLHRIIAGIYGRLETGSRERRRLFYIADVFDAEQREIWFDSVHVPGAGNRIVAVRIAAILARENIYPKVSGNDDEVSR